MTLRTLVMMVAVASAPLLALLPGSPLAVAQGPEVEFTRFELTPLVLPPGGGVLTVTVEAHSTLPSLSVALVLEATDGTFVRPNDRYALAPRDGSVHAADLEVNVPSRGPSGWWTVRVQDVREQDVEPTSPVSMGGTHGAVFLVHPDRPVAGLPEAPWPQLGGDAAHTGRTLSLGPRTIDVVRWTFEARDGQPFHAPVVAEDGTIYGVTWGGEVYALDPDGTPHWERPLTLASRVTFAPALDASGNVLVATEAGVLYAIAPERTVAWSQALALGGSGTTPRSPPVVAGDGRIHILHAPWHLLVLDPRGEPLYDTALEPPAGGAPTIGVTPSPVQGPALALDLDGRAVAVSGDGIAVLARNGTVLARHSCDRPDAACSPQAVSVVPEDAIALVSGGHHVTAVSLTTGAALWSTSDLPGTTFTDVVWNPPTVGWTEGLGKLVYIVSEDGWLRMFTLDGSFVLGQNLRQPLRSPVVVDGDGDIYFADACRGVRSWATLAKPRWTHEIESPGCSGLSSGLALTRSGGLLWPGPDGKLRMLGTNRLPVPAFTATWEQDGYVFDASASSDPDGTPLTYAWDFGDGASGHGVVVRHRFDRSGLHKVQLTVSDRISSVSTTQEVDVDFAPAAVLIDESEGLTVRLNASSSSDPEGRPLNFNWTLGGDVVGRGPVLELSFEEPRVLPITLSVSDGQRTARQAYTALAPAREAWRVTTLALFDGATCPSGTCSLPSDLAFLEGDLVELLVVNGASRTVEFTGPFQAILGGLAGDQVLPGAQSKLHFRAGDPGSKELSGRVAGVSGAPMRVPIEVAPAPTELTWWTEPLDGPVRVGREASVPFHVEGPAPASDVSLRFVLRSGVEEVASKRVTFLQGEPINATVLVAFVPSVTGPLEITPVVQSLDEGRVVTTAREGGDAVIPLTVSPPTFFQRTGDAITGNPLTSLLLGVGLPLFAGLVAYAIVRSRARGAEGGEGPPSTRSAAAIANGDATVVGGMKPRKVDRFEIERVLGEGGFGKTYLATDTILERRVVLKELEHVAHGAARELVLHEARTAANLSHQNVVVVHDVVEDKGRVLIVMEYVEGGTLAARLEKGPLDPKDALGVMQDILNGLTALHEAGIVHRDLKPSNILITPTGVAKITDFGVAAKLGDKTAPEDTFVGTPRYMAPEQLEGRAPGPSADLYAAGALLYEMLLGEHHLGVGLGSTPEATDLLLLRSNLPDARLSTAFNSILARALARDPRKRFESAQAFVEALRKLR